MRVSNLGYAAYLMLKDYKLLDTPTRTEDGKFNFNFEIDEELNKKLLHKYSISDFSKFDNYLVTLKRMLPRY
jgi:hypothetical protein